MVNMSILTNNQHCPPWSLHAWPPLLWQVGKQIPLRMQHLGTQVSTAAGSNSRSAGQTLWAWHGDEGEVGMAWDWVQIADGVVALADPLAIVTNLRLVGDEGEELSAMQSVLHINGIVHGLPWQHEVTRALSGHALQ